MSDDSVFGMFLPLLAAPGIIGNLSRNSCNVDQLLPSLPENWFPLGHITGESLELEPIYPIASLLVAAIFTPIFRLHSKSCHFPKISARTDCRKDGSPIKGYDICEENQG